MKTVQDFHLYPETETASHTVITGPFPSFMTSKSHRTAKLITPDDLDTVFSFWPLTSSLMPLVLVSFNYQFYIVQSQLRKEPELRDCPDHTGLSPYLQGIVLIVNWCRMVQPAVGTTIPWECCLGLYILRKTVNQEPVNEPTRSTLPWFLQLEFQGIWYPDNFFWLSYVPSIHVVQIHTFRKSTYT